MVDTLFIFTDMQFDQAMHSSTSTFEDDKREFHDAGYILPKIIFWNLRTSDCKVFPVQQNEERVALLSGFSSELLKCIMNNTTYTPMLMLRHVLEPYPILDIVKHIKLNPCPYTIEQLNMAIQASQFNILYLIY